MRGPALQDQTRGRALGRSARWDRSPFPVLGGSPGSPARKPSGAAAVSGFGWWIFHFCFETGEFLKRRSQTLKPVMAVS